MNAMFFGLLGIAGLLSIAIGASVGDYYGSDATGRGMTQAFTLLGSVAVWLVLSTLVAVCGARGAWPGRAKWLATLLVAAAIAGNALAFGMLNQLSQGEPPELLLRIFIGASPWLTIVCCVETLSPSLRRVQAVSAALLALLTFVPFAFRVPVQRQRAAARASSNRIVEDYALKLQAIRDLPDTTPVEQLLAYTDVPEMFTTDVPEAARARIRALPGKQASLEALLDKGSDLVLVQLNTFDLELTPELCAKARRNLARIAEAWRQGGAELRPSADRLVGPIRYLVRGGCACNAERMALEQAVGGTPDSFEKDQFLKRMAAIRATGGAE